MDVIFDWDLGNMIYNGLIALRLCGFPFVEIGVASDNMIDVASLITYIQINSYVYIYAWF